MKAKAWLRSALQWGLGLFVLWLLFRSVPLGETVEAARRADAALFAIVTVVTSALWFWIDSAAISYLVTRFHVPFSPREARSIRALSYLVAMINWNLGSGAIMLHLKRSKEVPLTNSLATILFYNSLDGFILLTMAAVGLATSAHGTRGAAIAVAGVLAGLVVLVAALRADRPDWEVLARLRNSIPVRTIRAATVWDFASIGMARLVYFLIFVFYFWAALRAFSVAVPALYLVGAVPLILLAAVLPVTPAGLGTQQAAMVYLLRPFGDEANILAFGLVFPVSFMIARSALALFYLGDLAALRSSLAEARSNS